MRRQKYTQKEAYMGSVPSCTFTRSILANCKPALYNSHVGRRQRMVEKVAVGRLEGLRMEWKICKVFTIVQHAAQHSPSSSPISMSHTFIRPFRIDARESLQESALRIFTASVINVQQLKFRFAHFPSPFATVTFAKYSDDHFILKRKKFSNK